MLVLYVFVNSVAAQTFLFQSLPGANPRLGFRYLHPFFNLQDLDLSRWSGVYELSWNTPVSREINLVFAIPYMIMNFETIGYEYSESGVGNIYIGMQYHQAIHATESANTGLGVFIPTASDHVGLQTWGLSQLSALTDNHQFQKYVPDLVTFHANVARHSLIRGGLFFGVQTGAYVTVPTEDEGDTEFFMHYGLSGGIQLRDAAIFAELLGLVIATEDDLDLSERFDHEVAFGIQWLRGLGVFYKLYLDDEYRDAVDGVLGIQLEAGL